MSSNPAESAYVYFSSAFCLLVERKWLKINYNINKQELAIFKKNSLAKRCVNFSLNWWVI
jgi:hypothetical protein